MPDSGGGFVAATPTGLVEAPHEVAVLAESEPFVEATYGVKRLDAYDNRCCGDVADPGGRSA